VVSVGAAILIAGLVRRKK